MYYIMGKLKDTYNKYKTTNRQKKKQQQESEQTIRIQIMQKELEQRWNTSVIYTCDHCLQEAYMSEVTHSQGYVTDEELILSSNYKLKHK